jgi:hypothetical protein
VAPLAVLGRLPEGMPIEDAIAAVAQRVVERLINEPPDRAKKLLTEALLLTGCESSVTSRPEFSRELP